MGRWEGKVDLFDIWPDEELFGEDFVKFRDAVVKRIRESGTALRNLPIVQRLAAAPDGDTFDRIMEGLYDIADRRRVWISTII